MGRLVIFAPMPGDTPVDLFKVLLKELEIAGAVNDRNRLDESIVALADPALALSDLVTHRFTIDDFERAFAVAETDRSAMKVAFVFPEPPIQEHSTA
jgi:threonine dehydrogenase-like Zn-dependent dehydrogenase